MNRILRGALASALALGLLATACSSDEDAGDEVSAEGDGADTSTNTADAGAGEGGEGDPSGASVDEPMPSPGCGTETALAAEPGTEVELRFDVDGTERFVLLTTPSAHDGETPLPLVVDLHGLMEGAAIHATMSQYSPLAEQEGFVVVFPHGSGEPVRWDAELVSDPNADLAYLDATLAKLGDELCLDTGRYYATGLSYGAIMTSTLACLRTDVFAAIAPVDGIRFPEGCEPSRPIPVWTTHGTADPILPFNGGIGGALGGILGGGGEGEATTTTEAPAYDLEGDGYPAAVRAWAEHNGCDPDPVDTEPADDILVRTYDCPEGADVEFHVVIGGGHSWPSSEFSETIADIVGPTTTNLDATADAWAFLSRFRLP